MRLFALEKSSGTFETLMTTPVSELQVVAAKFTAALFFYMVMWLPLLACLLIVRYYTSDSAALDAGAVGCTFLGILLLGGLFISLGCFASALTRNQMTAAIMALVFSFSLFLLSFLAEPIPSARLAVAGAVVLRAARPDARFRAGRGGYPPGGAVCHPVVLFPVPHACGCWKAAGGNEHDPRPFPQPSFSRCTQVAHRLQRRAAIAWSWRCW